jgi:protein XagA
LGAGNIAYAGALLEPPGDGQTITTATFSSTRRAFDPYGKLVPIPTYEKLELASYIEYGLAERLALIVRPAFSAFPAGSSGSSTNISSDLGLRIGLVDTTNIAISVQDEIPCRFNLMISTTSLSTMLRSSATI